MNIRREPPKNPLIRDGVSQGQRQLLALSPDFVKIDEGDLADFLVFAHQLSKKVSYYKDDNEKDGNWQEFFTNSTPVQIALIGKTRPERVKNKYREDLDFFLANNLTNYLKSQDNEFLKPIIANWRDVLQRIQEWHEKLETYTPLKSAIAGLVKTNLQEPLQRMYALEGVDLETTDFYENFARAFDLEISRELDANQALLTGTVTQARAELDFIFQALFQNYRQIIQLAPKYLRDSLAKRQDHPPHLSLYFAFWEVMRPARDDLNRMTQRHLDFFYRQVLQLRDRDAVPDSAHLIFELVKSITEYKLDKETRFLAGKDASGAELFYQLDAETVIHKAQIASLKGLFLDLKEIPTTDKPKKEVDEPKKEDETINVQGFYISPQVNSFDGEGGDFPKEQVVQAWLPFGDNTRKNAQLGLAIASNIFYLQEGERTLVFTLTFDRAPTTVKASDLPKIFTVEFSGEKDWIAGEIIAPQKGETSLENNILKLEVNLTAKQEPIDIYHSELDGGKLSTELPVARLQLKAKDKDKGKDDVDVQIKGLSAYSYFRNLKLTDLKICAKDIEVRNLVLQNDFAVLDPTKPFQPFGARPLVGSAFYVGSKEIFQKNLSTLNIEIRWQGLPNNLATYYRGYYLWEEANSPDFHNFSAKVERLTQRNWSSESLPADYTLFPRDNNNKYRTLIDRTNSQTPLPGENIGELTDFNQQTDSGFLRFLLNQDFLHDEFVQKYTIQTLASAKNFKTGEYVNEAVYEVVTLDRQENKTSTLKRWRTGDDDLPKNNNVAPITINEPYTPVIQEISLKYTAVAEKKDCKLFHLHPFNGFAEQESTETINFLPQFTNEGELLIGLENLDPPTALPLLFQVVEESADGELAKAQVDWYYLRDNNWISLSDRIINDNTNGLITSGIISVPIPEEISKEKTTILDPELHWIKASVKSRSRAICQIIGVHTQAARVTFVDAGNDGSHLATPLEAGTIAKLAVPTAEVKKVEQLYNSFGGQLKEQPSSFYTRISERLRHKGRAVNIFDYERLVLEKFPEIHQVRCINHGQVEGQQFNELVPGVVTLVVIPQLSSNRTSGDLEPKVNVNLREKIHKYLLTVSSPWTDIKVVNPTYEYIQVEFAVRFKSPYDSNFGYYSRELDRGITNFLTPWTINPQAVIDFGGTVYRSAILNFVEQQYYVDYIVDFQMHHQNQRNVREAIASTARSILTSKPVANTGLTHIINEINATNATFTNEKLISEPLGLGYEALENIILEE